MAAAVAKAIKQTIYNPIERIQHSLLTWFKANQRSFPWRNTSDPFKILIAEKLLQQTAATKAVVGAYEELNRLYPTPEALAAAPVCTLQTIISPLGFHYRAAELKRLATALVAKHQSVVPSEFSELMLLPGVGDYCARAVLAFGFGRNISVVDTNVARFLYRVFGLNGELPSNPARSSKLVHLADSLVPQGRARDFNLSVLDVCASFCTPSRPDCQSCPLTEECVFALSSLRH